MRSRQLWGDGEAVVRRVSLVRLSAEVARALADIGRVAVEGEVVRPKHHPGGTYFTLRDRAAQVSVRCPGPRVSRCRAVAGERVLVTASLAWAPDRGHLQLVAEEVVPMGEGAIAAAIGERRERLAAEGLLDRPRRGVPRLPVLIGVVCGSEAAVRDDIDSVVATRYPGYPLLYRVTNVSGTGAAEAVIDALRALDALPDVEVILLARGGGDAAQLLPFSDEGLCRAICESTTPVASAIGHHGDRPLCDEVADLRFGTPALAATALVPDKAELESDLSRLRVQRRVVVEQRFTSSVHRLASVDREGALRAGFDAAADRLRQSSARLRLVHPARSVAGAAGRLGRLDWRQPLAQRLLREQQRLGGHRRHLDALSPGRVLQRGYAVVRTGDGAVLRDPEKAPPGTAIDVQLAAGRLAARVEEGGR
ncbi:MAG: exodeoxyribonuclease VII large subunit [Actinomycetota bacterium]|nr:exodeoxyribonuclease VII large subunit [Actinomycetota bacterium]